MTAHVVYTALDKEAPATLSTQGDLARSSASRSAFDGLLMTDDLSMKALSGSFGERTRGPWAPAATWFFTATATWLKWREVAAAAGALKGKSLRRATAALKIGRKPQRLRPQGGAQGSGNPRLSVNVGISWRDAANHRQPWESEQAREE